MWDDDSLVFADICSPGTVENLRHNPAIEINVVDPLLRKGYRFNYRDRRLPPPEVADCREGRRMSLETPEQAESRLLKVIANAEHTVLPGFYAFEAMPNGLAQTRSDALACVRDGEFWSQLVPVSHPGTIKDLFKIFQFRFNPEFDATGFVGWLHSRLARTTGAASIVICGKDRRGGGFGHGRGNIFDYWGCPSDLVGAVLAEVESLIERGRTSGGSS